ncbi:MAG: hypothetical protein HGA45_26610 [Chloroflexales bacterium]|nr:hypothetical protein [Chloroflexales bacterium]
MSAAEHGPGHGGEGASPESVKIGFELSDWQGRPVIMMLIATFGALALGFIVIAGMVLLTGGEISDTSHALSPTGEAQLPAEPRLEQNPKADSERLIGEATRQLESYGWVSKGQGTAHIPIERAKELLLAKGVRPFGDSQPPSATPTP